MYTTAWFIIRTSFVTFNNPKSSPNMYHVDLSKMTPASKGRLGLLTFHSNTETHTHLNDVGEDLWTLTHWKR